MPAYVIFTDASLAEMCTYMPQTKAELLCVKGVGDAKADRYGEKFLEVSRAHISEKESVSH